jgi:hypothetical protein
LFKQKSTFFMGDLNEAATPIPTAGHMTEQGERAKSTCTSSPGRASMRQTRWGLRRFKLANKTLYRLIGIAEIVLLDQILVGTPGAQASLELSGNHLSQPFAPAPAPQPQLRESKWLVLTVCPQLVSR